MEPEGSLPCPQELATSPQPQPDESSPNIPILLSEDPIYFSLF
jgi:hypothetical protein